MTRAMRSRPAHGRARRPSGAEHWTIDEWFVVALARTIRDQEVVVAGVAGTCAQVAAHVARRTHAPRAMVGTGVVASARAPGRGCGHHDASATAANGGEGATGAADPDRTFRSGGQIDAYGNTDGGGSASAAVRALSLWTTRHRSGRTLVAGLDVGAVPGHHRGRPQWLVTELGIFDYGPDGHARLRALYPDVTPADVATATGFELRVDLVPGLPHPPSSGELAAVRAVDPDGARRHEFAPDELSRHFTHRTGVGCAC